MRFDIITIFPTLFESFLNESLLQKAIAKKIVDIRVHNLRAWTHDRHRTVDDKPYGGGPGMILKFEPIARALAALKAKRKTPKQKIIMLDPAGKQFDQATAQRWGKSKRIVFLCGRYEGFDHRITKLVDERVSIGPYVLNGGEVPAMAIIEATARLIPGFVGKRASLIEESFSKELAGAAEYPQYTRPEVILHKRKKLRVPKILLSGDPKKIAAWRAKLI